MKILFLSDNFPPESNAAASRVYERACHWVKWGHEVTVITSAPNFPQGKIYAGYKNKIYQEEMMDGIRVIRVITFMSANEGFALRILDFLSYMFSSFITGLFQKNYDIIISSSPQFFTAVGGWALAKVKRKPFIFELSDIWPATITAVGGMKQNLLLQWLEKLELFLYRQSTQVIALTEAFKKNLMKRGIAEQKISVVINGVELSKYQKIPLNTQLAQKYHLENKFVVGYIGTHGMAHALENVVAAAELLKDYPDIQFLFVGAGAKRAALIEQAEIKKLTNMHFIPAQPKNEIKQYWSLCNVALAHLKNDPTFAEVIPSKMFEAMGMGIPLLLASPAGEASSILLKEQAGLWVEAEKPDKLAGAILKLYQDSALTKKLANNSLNAATHYSRETQAKKMMDVLENIVLKNELPISLIK